MLKYGNLQPILPSLSIRETFAIDSSTETQPQILNKKDNFKERIQVEQRWPLSSRRLLQDSLLWLMRWTLLS